VWNKARFGGDIFVGGQNFTFSGNEDVRIGSEEVTDGIDMASLIDVYNDNW